MLNTELRVGRYELLETIGRGSMGTVYRGRDTVLDREVAIKVISPDLFEDEAARVRFVKEAKAAGRIHHRHIITIFEFGEEDERLFVVMELMRGRTLAAGLVALTAAALPVKLAMVGQICAAVAFAHQQGAIHRNLRPSSIWLNGDGSVTVADLGVGPGEGADAVYGSVERVSYLSPEQISGEPADSRSDVFSLGVILYELIAERRPFIGVSPTAIMLSIVRDAPPPVQHPALARLIDRALQKDPAGRYQSVADLASDLDIVVADLGTTVEEFTHVASLDEAIPDLFSNQFQGPEPPEASARTAFRWTDRRVLAVVAGVAIAGISGLALWSTGRRPNARNGTAGADGPSGAGRITSNRPAPGAPPELTITSQPSGAAIHINGRDSGLTTPAALSVNPTDPPRKIRLTLQGFQPREIGVTEVAQPIALTLVASEPPVKLIASSRYPFEIRDGTRVLSPASPRHELTVSGKRTVRLVGGRYFLDLAVVLDPAAGDTRTIELPPPTRLSVRAAPSLEHCQVWLDNRQVDYMPVNNLLVAPGKHQLQLRCGNDQNPGRQIEVVAGRPQTEVFR